MRKSRQLKIKNEKLEIKTRGLIYLFLVSAFGFLAFLIFKVLTLEKFIYVNKVVDGSAEIIIVDPSKSKITKYLIPFDTELDSARGYGIYKISSLWSISEKDNNGKLVPETITKNYSLPVYLWRNCVKWKDNCKSNLNIFQKVKIFFSKGIKISDEKINSTNITNSILIQFLNQEFIDLTPKIEVEDLTGSLNTLAKVSKIIEVLGGKIVSNSKGYDTNLDCIIYGQQIKYVHIFSNIFNCEEQIDNKLRTDLKIRLGAKFAERF